MSVCVCVCEQEVDNIYDEQKLQYRVGALSGGIAAIKVRDNYMIYCFSYSLCERLIPANEEFIHTKANFEMRLQGGDNTDHSGVKMI